MDPHKGVVVQGQIGLIKAAKILLLLIFSLDNLAFHDQILFFYSEIWIFSKKLGAWKFC